MLASLRRCAALPRAISIASTTARHVYRAPSSSAIQANIFLAKTSFPALRTFTTSKPWRQEAEAASPPAPDDIITTFKELETRGIVHPSVIRAITQDMGLSTMTDVQTATINEALAGTDIIAQARTGTGKTLAFLMPIFQRIISEDPSLGEGRSRTTASNIRAMVISPTRELAEQIAVEAERITRRTGVIVQRAVGGSHKLSMLQKMKREGCHLLIGTPGRIKDLLQDSYSGVSAPGLSIFVLDEADRLLDQGFWPEIQYIREMLPSPEENNVQTLMFSATVAQDIVAMVRRTLRPGFRFVKCVRDGEQQTHERVPQKLIAVNNLENEIPALVELAMREIAHQKSTPGVMPFKAIVYFGSTAHVELAFKVMRELQRTAFENDVRMYSMHGKLSQAERTFSSDSFRRVTSGILLSSDVSARGMDFPNVSHVIQVGVPRHGEDYIHRIGRTGRAGKPGTGVLIVNPLEQKIARKRLVQFNLPLVADNSLETAKVDMTKPAQLPAKVASILTRVSVAYQKVDREAMVAAYSAYFGMYAHVDDKQLLVDSMNQLTRYGWGLSQPPAVSSSFVAKMGLSHVRGLTLGSSSGGWQGPGGPSSADYKYNRLGAGSEDGFSRGGYGGGNQRGGYGGGQRGGYGGGQRGGYGGGNRGGGNDAFDVAFGDFRSLRKSY